MRLQKQYLEQAMIIAITLRNWRTMRQNWEDGKIRLLKIQLQQSSSMRTLNIIKQSGLSMKIKNRELLKLLNR